MLTSPVFRVAARAQKYRKLTRIAALASAASSNRAFTQPSTATKASVLDIPQSRLKNAEHVSGMSLVMLPVIGDVLSMKQTPRFPPCVLRSIHHPFPP
jgi:hypothetical protein